MTAPVSRATTIRSDEIAFAHKQMSETTTKAGSHKSDDVELENMQHVSAEHAESYFVSSTDLETYAVVNQIRLDLEIWPITHDGPRFFNSTAA